MKEVLVEVLGTEPPCARCNLTLKTIEKAVEKVKRDDITFKVEKRSCLEKETVKRFGVIVPPAVAFNNIVRISGRIPSEDEIKRLLESIE